MTSLHQVFKKPQQNINQYINIIKKKLNRCSNKNFISNFISRLHSKKHNQTNTYLHSYMECTQDTMNLLKN